MSENMISVSQFSNYIKQIFAAEEVLHNIAVYGEVSGFNISRGTAYFNIKDADALLPCVKFDADRLDYVPKEGDMVVVTGSPNYYVKGGRFSFMVSRIEAYGLGILYQKFLELKLKLEKEGLFDAKTKKPLPKHIKRVGVVTSESGAVLQDIVDITRRRNPLLNLVLFAAKVQGIGAEQSIAEGIAALDQAGVDVIIVARGGGSLEDLSCFNTELVARAVFAANTPIISAVGHETDFTICDFVADLRAPTPSAAAELVSVDLAELIAGFQSNIRKLFRKTEQILAQRQEEVLLLSENILSGAAEKLQKKYVPLREHIIRLGHRADSRIKDFGQRILLLKNSLEAKNPLSVLKMGYALVERDGSRVRTASQLKVGQSVDIKMIDGGFKSLIEKKGE